MPPDWTADDLVTDKKTEQDFRLLPVQDGINISLVTGIIKLNFSC